MKYYYGENNNKIYKIIFVSFINKIITYDNIIKNNNISLNHNGITIYFV